MKRSYYLLAFTIPLSISFSFYFQGVWSYLAIFYAFAFLPALELVLPLMHTNHPSSVEDSWKSSVYFDLILWFMVPIQYGLLIYFCQLMEGHQLELFERIGLITAMGLGCGVMGINVAHELGHRNNFAEQSMAKLLLSTSLYWHFFIEHNKGHHKNVSTPLDPESSHLNETLYAFWYRSIKDSFLSAYRIDASEMVKALILQILLLVLIFVLWGKIALVCFVASAMIGIILLESVNYIEHYGLSRREIAPLRYEKVRVIHSWNADNPLSRAVLFDLSRHSDHHAHANRKYQLLRSEESSPQMPTGYPGMILLALIPPLWFKVMNQKIQQFKF